MDSRGYKPRKIKLKLYFKLLLFYQLATIYRESILQKHLQCYAYYFKSALLIAAIISSAYGLVLGLKLVISLPSLPIKYL